MVRNSDILLLGYLFTPAQVGYYRVATSLTSLIRVPVTPLYSASYPELTYLWQIKDINTLKRILKRLVMTTSIIAITATVTIFIFGKWLIAITVSNEYLPALPVIYWLTISNALAIISSYGHALLLAMNKATSSLQALAVGLMGQIIILVILAPFMGIIAAGIASVIFYILWITIVLTTIYRVINPLRTTNKQ
ncbi:MAG: hypothetical protein CUN55_14145 [Phototrophicales bacterium]|nr:MAG: hypothetical protein CUN55_14145 [Phototrophicales bacterium]